LEVIVIHGKSDKGTKMIRRLSLLKTAEVTIAISHMLDQDDMSFLLTSPIRVFSTQDCFLRTGRSPGYEFEAVEVQAPIAKITTSRQSAVVGELVRFSAKDSYWTTKVKHPDRINIEWFVDNVQQSTPSPQQLEYTWRQPGRAQVKLHLRDPFGREADTMLDIKVEPQTITTADLRAVQF